MMRPAGAAPARNSCSRSGLGPVRARGGRRGCRRRASGARLAPSSSRLRQRRGAALADSAGCRLRISHRPRRGQVAAGRSAGSPGGDRHCRWVAIRARAPVLPFFAALHRSLIRFGAICEHSGPQSATMQSFRGRRLPQQGGPPGPHGDTERPRPRILVPPPDRSSGRGRLLWSRSGFFAHVEQDLQGCAAEPSNDEGAALPTSLGELPPCPR